MSIDPEQEKIILNECLVMRQMEGLVREYGTLIKATIRKTFRLVGISIVTEDVEDVCMEVFVRLFDNNCKKLRQFNPEKLRLSGWIKLIANQTTIDEIRRKDPHAISRRNERVMIEEVNHLLKYHYEENHEMVEKLGMVIETLEEMLPNDRMVLKMFYCEHLSLEEVSKKIGKTKKTTQTVKDRARVRLKKRVEERLNL
jgi:RNA polymerase sigma factor (sigma-70 family)